MEGFIDQLQGLLVFQRDVGGILQVRGFGQTVLSLLIFSLPSVGCQHCHFMVTSTRVVG